ncbi:MAG TPA: cyclohexanecarboxylate-CoA ligase, partial [Castellaniella sp.]|nr:cyclohexanecarboxylate-CoA ligase [Castellaniella sp.]
IGQVAARDLLDHLADRGLSKYDMPEWFVSLDTLPVTASGKILKRTLVEQVRQGAIKPVAVKYSSKEA